MCYWPSLLTSWGGFMSILLQSLYQERVRWTISLVLAHGTKRTGVGQVFISCTQY